MLTPQELFAQRAARMAQASRLETPDRVPFAPFTGFYTMLNYGISIYEFMMDPRNGIPGILQYMEEFEPDALTPPGAHPSVTLETLGATYIKWPGVTNALDRNASFQILDGTYIEDDEYEEFLRDPSHFQITKVIPRKFKELAPFAKLCFQNTSEFGTFPNFTVMAQPDVRQAILTAMRAGEEAQEYNVRFGQMVGAMIQAGGVPILDTMAIAPYDLFSDDFRGLVNTVMDMRDRPQQLLEAIEYTTQVSINAAMQGIAGGAKRCFIPLHAGTDEFMSPADYEKFYWPGLKKLMMALIEKDVTPVVFCEGNYNTRLDVISDVPKGKVEYLFEKVDLKKAKETVGKVACIWGNMPNSQLIYGTRQEVVDETKRILDIGAPGGGFIMSCAIVLDNAKQENMHAWMETTKAYGTY